jgi:hypothetical protein
MASNPLIAQGTLNRLRASVVWASNASLNVTAPYLGREGIRLALEGETTTFINTMTGAVTSPEPYQVVNLTINLLKTQGLASVYKAQMELTALIGDGTVYPDASTLPTYSLINCAIQSVRELSFAGEDAGWVVVVKGYYLINSSLWGQG